MRKLAHNNNNKGTNAIFAAILELSNRNKLKLKYFYCILYLFYTRKHKKTERGKILNTDRYMLGSMWLHFVPKPNEHTKTYIIETLLH